VCSSDLVEIAPMPGFASLPPVVEDGLTFEANAGKKAEAYSRYVAGEMVLADDSGLEVDALGGIQFQVPNGGHWDYRPGMNNNGGQEFTSVTKTNFDVHLWSRVEILADAAKGTARMAVAQPPGSKAVAVLDFKDPAAGKVGPIAWQMHNAGLFDQYREITIEPDPKDDGLITL
jgi:hypothetical protein